MKNTLFFATLFFSFFTFSQTDVWHQLPDVPVGGGSIDAASGDLAVADDGTVYNAYMWDDGAGLKFYISNYTQGTGWTVLYSEAVYSGMQAIRSRKSGTSVYFVTKIGDGGGNNLFKVYFADAGSVVQYASVTLPDYPVSGDFDFEMGADTNFGYLLYKSAAGLGLDLSLISYSGNSVTTSTLTLPNSATAPNTYDMTVAGDSVFIGLSIQFPSYKAYLYKAGPTGSPIVPYASTTPTGELLNPASVSTNALIVNSDGIGRVYLSAYDFGNMAALERMYENGALSTATYIGTLAENYSIGDAAGTDDRLLTLNNYSPSNAPPYNTYVVSHQLSTDVFDTIAAPGAYVLATNSPTEHRLSYSDVTKRISASFYDPTESKRAFYLTNSLPYLASVDQSSGVCQLPGSTIFNNVAIGDANGDLITILSVSSTNTGVLDPASVATALQLQDGINSNFYIYGDPVAAGTATLSIEVTDGWDTLTLELPQSTVVSPNTPVFNVQAISICSGQGEVNLFDYISQTGGNFYINALEFDFEDGVYNTDDSPLSPEDVQTLTYALSDGVCNYETDVNIVFHTSPAVSVTNTPTTCGQGTATATALVSGGATPYVFSQWSTGEQNTNNVSGLGAGQHSYTITDANACATTSYFNVLSTGANATGTITNVSCNGGTDGAIALATTGLTAPITALWSSGHSTLNLSGVPIGNYTVDLSDANGCMLSKTFVITQPEPLTTEVTVSQPTCGVADGTLSVFDTQGGTAPYQYAWSNGDTGPTSSNAPFGIYSLTTSDNNGCQFINTIYLSEAGSADLYGTITPSNCGAAQGAIDVSPWLASGTTISSILWSNGATTEDISNLAPQVYVCTLLASNNCTAIKGWDIPVVEPLRNEICVVTVDSATTTNLVVWEKLQTTGIAYYNIYRESSIQGEFALIDTVHADNISLFNDVVASPTVRSWRYKISAVNGCDVEGPLSSPHQTIHLDVLDNSGTDVTVNWNAYQGASFSNYIVSRYTDLNGWETIATVPATQLTYTDNTPITTAGLDYMVEIELDQSCTAFIWKSQDFNSSRSNKDKGQFSAGDGTGNSNNGLVEMSFGAGSVLLYPNPAAGGTVFVQLVSVPAADYRISSITGQQVAQGQLSEGTSHVTLQELHPGVYIMQLYGANEQMSLRFIVE